MGVDLEQIATEANSTDVVSSICPELWYYANSTYVIWFCTVCTF